MRKLLLVVSFIFGGLASSIFLGSEGVVDSHEGHEDPVASWSCSMHPQIKQPDPGQCPICGMDLIALRDTVGEGRGPKTVVLSERAKAMAKIRTTPVRRRHSQAPILRLLGRIEPNETSIKDVTAWTGGRIDRLHVKVTGERVRKGQVIATLYSPEVFSAHQDLIVARKQIVRMASSSDSSRRAASRAQGAARSRLRLLGVPPNEVAKMEQQEQPTTSIAIRTPFGGTVMQRVATEGAYVATGALLYKIADLTELWFQLDAYERDLPNIRVGQDVDIRVQGIPQEIFRGKVAFIDPTLDSKSRTSRVRVAVKNEDGRLRPGMFAEADVKSQPDDGGLAPLVIPSTSPLFTGRRSIVFVEDPNANRPTYKARVVRLGPRSGDEYPVVAGLSLDERVVISGAFALDADLQIRGGESMMGEPDDTQVGAWDDIIDMSPKERKAWAPALAAYLDCQKSLAADDFDGARDAAARLVQKSITSELSGSATAVQFWSEHKQTLAAHASSLVGAKGIEEARGIFEPLSRTIISLLQRLGNPLDSPVRLAFCPMAMGSKGAEWIQDSEVIDNSYFGAMMLRCGEIRATAEPGSHLPK